MEPLTGKTDFASIKSRVSTKLQRIAEMARNSPDMEFKTLAHHVDVDMLLVAYHKTRKDGAVGLDGVTGGQYCQNLNENLDDLWRRLKSGRYRAPSVRRVEIPKGPKGKEKRPIGIPTFEDKVAQRAYSMVLSAIFEEDFLDCSYGFRPKRSQHMALGRIQNGLFNMCLAPNYDCWVLEVDIKGFFDNLEHRHMREILSQRVSDPGIIRTVGKWLNAGVMENGVLSYPEKGTPQGGVISPLLANIYLHTVLDAWFETDVKPRLEGESFLVRYADDFVICFASQEDALRVMSVLPKRFAKYGLTVNEAKTRLVKFERPPSGQRPDEKPGTFDFLGFTHYWAMSRRKWWVVKRKTMRGRLSRSLSAINVWCRKNRHRRLSEQRKRLTSKMRGHYAYYGITGNYSCLETFYRQVRRIWRKWLDRRSRKAKVNWEKMALILKRYPLPAPRIIHRC